jgi:Transposase domain (DUF772)
MGGEDRTSGALFSDVDMEARTPAKHPLRATLLQLLYTIRSERQLVERIEFDLLFRWFVGLSIDETVFDASTFSKNRDRLLPPEIAQKFLASFIALPEVKRLLSAEHFSVDGTLLKAWASMRVLGPKMVRARRRPAALARRISARRSGRTRRTPRRRTRMRGSSARAKARKAVFAISATR